MSAKDSVFRLVTTFHRTVFRASGGRLAGKLLGMPVVVLTTTGRTTGRRRETMLTTPLQVGETIVLVASYGGDDREPAWCRNLRQNPIVHVTMRGRDEDRRARVAGEEERAELWPQVTAAHPNYAGYQTRTSRVIPLVLLEPLG